MLYSMTGYGEHSVEAEGVRAGFRIKCVNNKGLDLNLKLPFDLMYLETELRPILSERLHRGRIDIFAEIDINDPEVRPETPLNVARLAQLMQMATQMKAEYGVGGELDINTLVRLPDLTLALRVGFRLPERMAAALREALTGALDSLLDSRAKEGEKLKVDLLARLNSISEIVTRLEAFVGVRHEELRSAILKRVSSLMDEFKLDDFRLYQEVIYYADRLDVTEEITRLRAHLGSTLDLIESGSRSIGKELDFMVQEQMREVSTIGNKAKHKEIADIVVQLKTEYEKIREQVQNIE